FSKRWEAEYVQKYNYFVQSKSAYKNTFTDEDGFEVTATSQTKRSEFEHWAALWYRVTPEFGVSWRVGEEQQSWNAAEAEGRPDRGQRLRFMGPQIRFPITKNANFIFGYSDKVDYTRNNSELGQFLADNTEFTLLSFVRF